MEANASLVQLDFFNRQDKVKQGRENNNWAVGLEIYLVSVT